MKIVGVGNYDELIYQSTHWLGHVEGFAELGHEFEFIDFRRLGQDETLQRIKDVHPDFVLLGISDIFKDDFLERLRESTKAKIAWWYCDYGDYKQFGDFRVVSRSVKDLIDYMFLSNREQIPFYKETLKIEKVFYLPQACLKRERLENPVPKYMNETVFVGEIYGSPIRRERQALLEEVMRHFPLAVYPNCLLDKQESYKVHHLFYPSVKIALGTSWHDDSDLYSSNRIFLTIGNGGFYLCNYFKNMEEVWAIGSHLDAFHSPGECIEKIGYYLGHDEEREKIRRQGFAHAQKHHTYTRRLENMLDIINDKTDTFYGYLSYIHNHSDLHS